MGNVRDLLKRYVGEIPDMDKVDEIASVASVKFNSLLMYFSGSEQLSSDVEAKIASYLEEKLSSN